MLPIGDDDTARRTVPVVTYAMIALNVLFDPPTALQGRPARLPECSNHRSHER